MNYKDRYGKKNNSCSSKKIILVIFSAVMMIIFLFLFWNGKIFTKQKSQKLQMSNELNFEKNQNKQVTLEQKEIVNSFYKKLATGIDVNILIVGDSIGEGAGTKTDGQQWYIQLQSYLKTTYQVSVSLTNISMGGNASYAGYVRTMTLDDDVDYDLAIICYGQNDDDDGFSTNYESIIRSIERKYSNCSIISILESSQREYTKKIITIQYICKHYGIPVADMIASFNNCDISYDELTDDGIHPNDAGQDIYFNTVKNIIDENVHASTGKMDKMDTINANVSKFDNFEWFGVDERGFKRTDDTTFILNMSSPVSCIMGIDYVFVSGDNKADIYVDGELYKSLTVTFNYDFSQRHIMVVNEGCSITNEIKVIFNTKEQAEGFSGMCFSWE